MIVGGKIFSIESERNTKFTTKKTEYVKSKDIREADVNAIKSTIENIATAGIITKPQFDKLNSYKITSFSGSSKDKAIIELLQAGTGIDFTDRIAELRGLPNQSKSLPIPVALRDDMKQDLKGEEVKTSTSSPHSDHLDSEDFGVFLGDFDDTPPRDPAPAGFILEPIDHIGANCLFKSFSSALNDGDQHVAHEAIRDDVVKFMRENVGDSHSAFARSDYMQHPDQPVDDKYLNKMQIPGNEDKPAEYGGRPEILAFALMHQIPVYVHRSDAPTEVYPIGGIQGKSERDAIHIVYNRVNHYDLLKYEPVSLQPSALSKRPPIKNEGNHSLTDSSPFNTTISKRGRNENLDSSDRRADKRTVVANMGDKTATVARYNPIQQTDQLIDGRGHQSRTVTTGSPILNTPTFTRTIVPYFDLVQDQDTPSFRPDTKLQQAGPSSVNIPQKGMGIGASGSKQSYGSSATVISPTIPLSRQQTIASVDFSFRRAENSGLRVDDKYYGNATVYSALVGAIGEFETHNALKGKVELGDVDLDIILGGDGGRDIKIGGESAQVKFRRGNQKLEVSLEEFNKNKYLILARSDYNLGRETETLAKPFQDIIDNKLGAASGLYFNGTTPQGPPKAVGSIIGDKHGDASGSHLVMLPRKAIGASVSGRGGIPTAVIIPAFGRYTTIAPVLSDRLNSLIDKVDEMRRKGISLDFVDAREYEKRVAERGGKIEAKPNPNYPKSKPVITIENKDLISLDRAIREGKLR